MAVQAEEAAPVVRVARRKRRGQLGLAGGIAVDGRRRSPRSIW